MSAATYNFELEQGVTRTIPFVWKDSTGSPIDLLGYTARMQIRMNKSSSQVMLELTTENGGIVLGGLAGSVTLEFTEESTSKLTRGGVYDLELVNSDGTTVIRLVEGTITLSKGVTRNA